jgi:hypothetical protein
MYCTWIVAPLDSGYTLALFNCVRQMKYLSMIMFNLSCYIYHISACAVWFYQYYYYKSKCLFIILNKKRIFTDL